jgi:hypothetical protein
LFAVLAQYTIAVSGLGSGGAKKDDSESKTGKEQKDPARNPNEAGWADPAKTNVHYHERGKHHEFVAPNGDDGQGPGAHDAVAGDRQSERNQVLESAAHIP